MMRLIKPSTHAVSTMIDVCILAEEEFARHCNEADPFFFEILCSLATVFYAKERLGDAVTDDRVEEEFIIGMRRFCVRHLLDHPSIRGATHAQVVSEHFDQCVSASLNFYHMLQNESDVEAAFYAWIRSIYSGDDRNDVICGALFQSFLCIIRGMENPVEPGIERVMPHSPIHIQ
ncbi:MAG: hypothetical protein ACK50Q_18285 [Labrys sp. (in: a-proteobacteria)]